MSSFSLAEGVYIHPTPAGAYYAVSATDNNPSRRLLQALLQEELSPLLTLAGLRDWMGIEEDDQVLTMLHHAQGLGWVQGLDKPLECDQAPLEKQLPVLLRSIASQGKALLADSEGFYLASSGFPHEVAEELSALSAELATVHRRRAGLLVNNLGLGSNAWAIVDAAGNSRIGFWPLFIGNQRFVLTITGMPQFNHPDFVDLVWILSRRYAVMGA